MNRRPVGRSGMQIAHHLHYILFSAFITWWCGLFRAHPCSDRVLIHQYVALSPSKPSLVTDFFFLSSLHILASVISCVALCSLVARLRNQEDDSKYIRNIKHHLTFIHKSLSFFFFTVKEPCHGIIHTCTRTHTHATVFAAIISALYNTHNTL